MKIGICDDDRYECERVRTFINDLTCLDKENIEAIVYEPDELVNIIDSGKNIRWDIMIMDIEFINKNYDGIDLTKRINKAYSECQIIYLTHILEFAPEVYETEHCYFVMKNNMELMLPRAMEKAVNVYNEKVLQKPLEIMSGGHIVYIKQDDIIYVEKNQRQTVVHTDKKSYACYESISALSKKLCNNMVRCHGGYIVNISHITYLGGEKIITDIPDMEIPIGKTYKEQTKQAYLKYWMNRM